jgi:hypothetical protein
VEKEELLKVITDQVKALVAESQKDNVKQSDLDTKVKELNANVEKLDNEGLKSLKASMDELAKTVNGLADAAKLQGETLKTLTEKGIINQDEKPKSFNQALRDAFMEKSDGILIKKSDMNGERLSMKDYFTEKGNKNSPQFVVKSAVDMLQSGIFQNQVPLVQATQALPGIVGIPLGIYPTVLDYIPSINITLPYMSALVAYDYQDGSGVKTEGSASGKSSMLFKTMEFKAFWMGTHFVLSEETLDDFGAAIDQISIAGPDKLKKKINSDVISGNGNGTSTGVASLISTNNKTDFDAAAHAAAYGTIDGANVIDLIVAMKAKCESAEYIPNVVLLNPVDVYKIGALKNSLDDSVSDRRIAFNQFGEPVSVAGLAIIKSVAVTANQVVVMDRMQALIGKRRDLTLDMQRDGTDFTEGQITVRLSARLAFAVLDKAAVVYSDDIATDVAAINSAA